MGGTSTDVSHYAGQFELADESVVAGVRIRAPMMQIHTVAAGGGSICRFDGMRFRVGPESAGRGPGPGLLPQRRAADRHRLQPASRQASSPTQFPAVFGPNGDQPLDAGRSRARLQEVADELGGPRPRRDRRGVPRHRGRQYGRGDPQISIARGHDVTRYTLPVSAARAASMPAASPMRSAWSAL